MLPSYTILIADDDPIGIAILKKILGQTYRVATATTGEEALQLAVEIQPDMILLDIMMPGIDGYETCRQMRAHLTLRYTKILMVSAKDTTAERLQGYAMGADDYITKPVEKEELLAKVRVYLRLRSAEEAEERLRHMHERTMQLLAAIPSILIGLDPHLRIVWWNPTSEQTFGRVLPETLGQPLLQCRLPWDVTAILQGLLTCRTNGKAVVLDDVSLQPPGENERVLGLTIVPMPDPTDHGMGFLLAGVDLTEYKLLQRQLAQAQKLEALGQLAAGIAHEIHTPMQYIGDNTCFLRQAFHDLHALLGSYDVLLQANKVGQVPQDLISTVESTAVAIDTAYLMEEIPTALQQSLTGIDRVATIVRSMKEFSHPGSKEKSAINLNRAIENTVTVAHSEWRYVADVVTDLAPTLPPVPCFPGEINQVLLNLIVNAAHAIADVVRDGAQEKGRITISTHYTDDWAEIRIADTGTGIPAAIQDKVFNPFFTTKEVGKGTGQGLAMVYDVIVQKHRGTITFETTVGHGTTFVLRLPLATAGALTALPAKAATS